MTGLKLNHAMKQKQTLSFSMGQRQSLKMLQASLMDLKADLQKQLQDNPLAEIEDVYTFREELNADIADTRKPSRNKAILSQLRDGDQINLTAADEILYQCDGNGWLRISEKQLAENLHLPLETIHKTRIEIMHCEPEGIAALNLSECLEAQMHPSAYEEELALKIIQKYLPQMAEGKQVYLCEKLQCSKEDLQKAMRAISSLNPRPGEIFDANPQRYIKPEIRIEHTDSGLKAIPIRYFIIRINKYESKHLTEEERQYINDSTKEIQSLIHGLNRRETTLLKLMNEMIRIQENYLIDHAVKQVCRLKELSSAVGLHTATVSRALQDKYYEMDGLVYPMNVLLNKEIRGTSVSQCMDSIRKIIERDPASSDQRISEELLEEGIVCSRRTVAKYRKQMHITISRKRKSKLDDHSV